MNQRDGVYRRGKVVYIRYRDERGRDVRESTRQSSLEFARSLLAKRRVEVAECRHLRSRAFDRVTFKELRAHWWEQHGSKTRSQFQYLLPRIDVWFADMRARDVTSDTVQRFLDHLSETEFDRRGNDGTVTQARLAPSSVNHYRTILNSIFSFAGRRGLYDRNPVRAVPQLREPPEREVVLLPHEFQRLLSELEKIDTEAWVAVVVLATTTLRKGELLARRWSDLHLDAALPYISVPHTKTGRAKRVPLCDAAVEALRRLPSWEVDDYVFPSRPTTRHPDPVRPHRWDIGDSFRKAARAANLPGLRVHDLRHVSTSVMTVLGVPEPVIRKVTGHRSRALERYQHLSRELRAQTVNRLADYLLGSGTEGLGSGTNSGTLPDTNEKPAPGIPQVTGFVGLNAGVSGTSFATGS